MSRPHLAYNRLKNVKSTNNPIIINIHGFLGDKSMFHRLSRSINKEIDTDIFNIDLRNHGDSFSSSKMDYISMTDDLIHFINFKFSKSQLHSRGLHFIGFSMGSKIAMLCALKLNKSNFIRKIVSIDMPPYYTPQLPKELIDKLKIIEKINQGEIKIKSGTNSWRQEVVDKLGLYFASGFFKNKTNNVEGSNVRHYLPIDKLPNLLDNLKDWPVFSNTMDIKCDNTELLLLKGKNSPLIADDLTLIDQIFPKNKLVEFNTGHNVLFEDFENVSRTITNFLKI